VTTKTETRTAKPPLQPPAAARQSPSQQPAASGQAERPAEHTEGQDSQEPRHVAEATQTASSPNTVPPCPQWCNDKAGHDALARRYAAELRLAADRRDAVKGARA
jgi:hypothetical protein